MHAVVALATHDGAGAATTDADGGADTDATAEAVLDAGGGGGGEVGRLHASNRVGMRNRTSPMRHEIVTARNGSHPAAMHDARADRGPAADHQLEPERARALLQGDAA